MSSLLSYVIGNNISRAGLMKGLLGKSSLMNTPFSGYLIRIKLVRNYGGFSCPRILYQFGFYIHISARLSD